MVPMARRPPATAFKVKPPRREFYSKFARQLNRDLHTNKGGLLNCLCTSLASLLINRRPVMIILMMNVIMLVVGMFLDLPAAILLLGPTFVAIGNVIGLDLIQLGIMMAVNLSIGLFTPPVGTTLFIGAAISKEPVGAIVKELWPFYLVALVVLGIVSFVPAATFY